MHMDTSLSPENILKRYIANCEYGLWRHDRDRFDRPRFFWPDETPSFEDKKKDIMRKLKEMSYYSLVSPYLFPKYDEYEVLVKDFITNTFNSNGWHWERGEKVQIPKSRAYPNGGWFSSKKIRVPRKLFSDIEDRFFDEVDITLTVIKSSDYSEIFWENLEPGYFRKETLDSMENGRFKTIKADGTLVVNSTSGLPEIVPAIMSVLLCAWMDHAGYGDNDRNPWMTSSLGKGKYKTNIGRLMVESDNECLSSIGLFLKEAAELNDRVHRIRMEHDGILTTWYKDVEAAVNDSAKELEEHRIFSDIHALWTRLGHIEMMMQSADRTVYNTWNRCVHTKANSLEEVMRLLKFKYLGLCEDVLGRLAQNITYAQMNVFV